MFTLTGGPPLRAPGTTDGAPWSDAYQHPEKKP
jgi:hypothetical protein